MSYPQHVRDAVEGCSKWDSCMATPGTNVRSAILALASKGVVVVLPRPFHKLAHDMAPPNGARLVTPNPAALKKLLAENPSYHTVVLFMDGINQGEATWKYLGQLIHNKRMLIVSGG